MRDASCLMGTTELGNIKKHMIDSLDADERIFVNTIDERIEDLISERNNKFLNLNEIVKLRKIEKKYRHLKPFTFGFDPEIKIPKVARNRTAFIIWTVWRSNHILGQKENLDNAALASAGILNKYRTPYSLEAKEKAIQIFKTIMEKSAEYGMSSAYSDPSSFWLEKIFPYLEGEWEFKWEMKS